jgi:large conductance mechanosensitive channel
MGFVSEFREFALKGNVLDLAVGVIIGGAFGKIVNSMIEDLIMPVVGIAGNVDFSKAAFKLADGTKAVTDAAGKVITPGGPDVMLRYGSFITIVINFVILAFCIFLVVKAFNTAKKRFEAEKPAPAPAGPSSTDKLLMEIRDALKR